MSHLKKESADNYYEELMKYHGCDIKLSKKINLFFNTLEQEIFEEITGCDKFDEQINWFRSKEDELKSSGVIGRYKKPLSAYLSDLINLKMDRNVGTHNLKDTEISDINYKSHFETMAKTIMAFSGKYWPEKINNILSYKQETYDDLTYDELVGRGDGFYKNGNYEKAQKYYEEARRKAPNDEEKEVELYEKMAETFSKLGTYNKAISFFSWARDICSRYYGNDTLKTAKISQKIGVVYRKDMKYEKAKENFLKAEEIFNKKPDIDPDKSYIANLYNDFGLMYLNKKEFDDVEFYYKASEEIRENNFKNFGNDKEAYYIREYAYSVHNMGTYHNKLVTDRFIKDKDKKIKHLKDAASYHEKAYDLRKGLLKGEEPLEAIKKENPSADLFLAIAQSLTLWASDLLELDTEKDAKIALNKCSDGLEIRKVIGANTQDVSWSYYTLGMVHDKLGKNKEEALDYFKKSYEIRFNVSKEDHLYAAKALYQMGRMKFILNKDTKEALQDLNNAYDIQIISLREDDPELQDTKKLIDELEKRLK